MIMKKPYLLITIMILTAICLMGCRGNGTGEHVPATLIVETRTHGDTEGSGSEDTVEYTDVQPGEVVFDSYGSTITVKKVYDDRIVMTSNGGLIEPNADGTINLGGASVKKIDLHLGDEITLSTQTMDGGAKAILRYVASE